MHVYVPGQQRAVGDDDVAAQLAIVSDVAASHEEVVVADGGDAFLLFGGAVDRHAFANDVVVADDDFRVAAAVGDVLRLAAEDHVRIDVIVAADRHVAHHGDVVFQSRAAADAGFRPDDAVRADLDVIVDFGAGVDGGVFGKVAGHDRGSFTEV